MSFSRFAASALLAASALFGADQALLALVNPDAKVVGGIHVSRTLSSPFGQFLLSRMNAEDRHFREFTTLTGFDPRRDLREVVFSSTADAANQRAGVVVARGVFNGPQILASARTKGHVTTTNYKGVDILQSPDGGGLAFLDGSLAIAGDLENVRKAIDRRAASAVPPSLQKASILMNRYDAWMVSTAPVGRFAGAAPNQVQGPLNSNAMQGILETSGGVTFDSLVLIEGEALTRSEKDAQALIDVVKFVTGMLQMHSGNNPKWPQIEPILNSLEMRPEASTVKFSLRIAEADLEQLVKPAKAPARRAAVR